MTMQERLAAMLKNAQDRHDALASPLSSEVDLEWIVTRLNMDMTNLLNLLADQNAAVQE